MHIPIGYDGIEAHAGLSLAWLVRDAEAPCYIHCHHGRHRGPAAAAIACLAAGDVDRQGALDILERAGTSKNYAGLWRAVETYRVPASHAQLPTLSEIASLCKLLAAKQCFLQPFMPGITAEGEFSLMYFHGCRSHSILKTALDGDFRVQEEHGGGVIPVRTPEPKLVSVADRVIATLSDVPLYARVDLVRTCKNTFALMELELIEPCLYFRFAEHSAPAFAKAIVGRYLHNSAN